MYTDTILNDTSNMKQANPQTTGIHEVWKNTTYQKPVINTYDDRDQLNANQDSGYHSLSSSEISNSNNNKNQVLDNEYHKLCPINCKNCLEYGQGYCYTMNKNLNGTSLNHISQQSDCYKQSYPFCAQNGVIQSNFSSIQGHGNYQNNVHLTDGKFVNNNYASQEMLRAQNEELELKIEFCLKFGFSIEQIRFTLNKMGRNAIKDDILNYLCSAFQTNHSALEVALESNSDNVNTRTRGPLTSSETKPKTRILDESKDLRPIIIDGSNVAMSHGSKEYFSCKGIQIAVNYFWNRNHRDITVFVPKYRREQTRPDAPIKDQDILDKLEKDRILVYTPSRYVDGKRITCYDDRFILQLALETEGVIVSNDFFRDLQNEKPEWKELINKRLLMYSFANDRFMVPDDPQGRNGITLDNLLRKHPLGEDKPKTPPCPYGKKCTYGKKCKFFHPENSQSKSVTEMLKESTKKRLQPSTDAKKLAQELMQSASPKDRHANKEMQGAAANPEQVNQRLSPKENLLDHQEQSVLDIDNKMKDLSMKSHYNQCPPKDHMVYYGYPESTQQSKREERCRSLMPPLHSAHRNTVTSSTSPQQRQIQTHPNMNQYHSSPSALPSGYGVMFTPQSQQVPQEDIRQNVPYQYQPNYQPAHFPQQILYPMAMPANMMLLPGHQVPTSQSFNQQQAHRMGHSQDSSGHPHSLRMSQHVPSNPAFSAQSRQVFSSPNPQAQRHAMSVCMSSQQMPSASQQSRLHHPQQPFKNESDSRYNLYKNLCALFPHATVERVLTLYPEESNPTRLAKLCLEF